MIRLLVADDHQILLDGFASMFESIEDLVVVGTATNGQEVLDFLKETKVDVILMDINMPVLNGVEACKKIKKKYNDIHVIALSMYKQPSYVKRMIQYGASGYLLKNDSIEEIDCAIRAVLNGEQYISQQLKFNLENWDFIRAKKNKPVFNVSSREIEVLQLLSKGHTDQEIAAKLYISFHTVNSHRKNLVAKFNAKNTAQLIRITMEKGII